MKKVLNEGNEFSLYFDKPVMTGNQAFIPIMNDMNSGDPVKMARAKEMACAQMERIIVKMISQSYGSYAKKYGGELKQAGFVGVLTAMEVERSKRYDPYSKYTPSAFFFSYIKHEICAYLNSIGPAVTSSHYSSSLKTVRKAIEYFTKRDMPYDETVISQYTGISLDTVKVCFSILKANEGSISYNDLTESEGGEGALGLNYETPEKTVEENARYNAIMTALENVLSENERYVVLNSFGFNGPIKTANVIAGELKISESQVKKLKKRALEKLRITPLRQWHATDGAHDGTTNTDGVFTFFPSPSGQEQEDNAEFTSLFGGLNIDQA